jgi:hypothetical protein
MISIPQEAQALIHMPTDLAISLITEEAQNHSDRTTLLHFAQDGATEGPVGKVLLSVTDHRDMNTVAVPLRHIQPIPRKLLHQFHGNMRDSKQERLKQTTNHMEIDALVIMVMFHVLEKK